MVFFLIPLFDGEVGNSCYLTILNFIFCALASGWAIYWNLFCLSSISLICIYFKEGVGGLSSSTTSSSVCLIGVFLIELELNTIDCFKPISLRLFRSSKSCFSARMSSFLPNMALMVFFKLVLALPLPMKSFWWYRISVSMFCILLSSNNVFSSFCLLCSLTSRVYDYRCVLKLL